MDQLSSREKVLVVACVAMVLALIVLSVMYHKKDSFVYEPISFETKRRVEMDRQARVDHRSRTQEPGALHIHQGQDIVF